MPPFPLLLVHCLLVRQNLLLLVQPRILKNHIILLLRLVLHLLLCHHPLLVVELRSLKDHILLLNRLLLCHHLTPLRHDAIFRRRALHLRRAFHRLRMRS